MKENMKDIKEQKLFIPGEAGQLETCFAEPDDRLILPNGDAQKSAHNIQSAHSAQSAQSPQAHSTLIGIVCHPHPLHQGTMNNKVVTTITKAWQQMGLHTLRFNFRGVGLSAGEYSHGEGEQNDLRSVINWVFEHYPTARLYLGGFSFGAFISTKVASLHEYPISALLSVAPPLRFFSFATETLPKAPWVIIQGEQDELVDHHEVVAWYEDIRLRKSNVQFISFKDTTHFFHGRLMDLKAEIMASMKPFIQK